MKTITLKADRAFDATLTELANRMDTSKSAVIREAVGEYKRQLDREALAQRIREASLKTRQTSEQAVTDFEDTNADGL